MPKSVSLGKIEREVEKLTTQEQLRLLEKPAGHLRKSGVPAEKELGWKPLYGLGQGIWDVEDAQDCVNRLRVDSSRSEGPDSSFVIMQSC